MPTNNPAGNGPVDRHVRALEEGARGTGRTTRQIKDAPPGAIFVWCNNRTEYPKMLALKLGRGDIEVVPPVWLVQGWVGRNLTGIVIDHAARLTDCEWHGLGYAEARVLYNVELTGAKPIGEASGSAQG